jgi:hypothetical protein
VQTAYLKPRSARQGGGQAYQPPADAPAMKGGPGYKPPDPNAGAEKYVEIPEKYEEAQTSGLTYTVTGGKQTHEITLD